MLSVFALGIPSQKEGEDVKKIKKKSVWRDKKGNEIRVSRLRKDEICFYPKGGGGAEQKLARDVFLARYEPI